MNIFELKNVFFEIVNFGVYIFWKFLFNIYYIYVCIIYDIFGNFLERNLNKCIFYGFNKSYIYKIKVYWYIIYRNCY